MSRFERISVLLIGIIAARVAYRAKEIDAHAAVATAALVGWLSVFAWYQMRKRDCEETRQSVANTEVER